MVIGHQAEESIKQQEKQYQIQISTDLQRLQEFQKSTINYQRKKIQKQISRKIIDFALQKVEKKLRLNQSVQKSINIWSIEQLQKF